MQKNENYKIESFPHVFSSRGQNLLLGFEDEPTPGLNFINIQCTAFTLVDPKILKRYWRLDWSLTLLGATGVKAARKMLMKSTPGVNYIKVLCAVFTHEDPESIKIQLSCQYLFTLLGSVCVKAVHRMLAKLTPACSDWQAGKVQFICSDHGSISSTCLHKAFMHADPKSAKNCQAYQSFLHFFS